jgi:hypothetical protein
MKADGEYRDPLQTDSLNALIGDPSIRVFRLQPKCHATPVDGSWLPPWASATDAVGGVATKAKTKTMKKPHVVKRPASKDIASLPSELQQTMKLEVASWVALAADMSKHTEFGSTGSWSCPLCPTRRFSEKRKLVHHFSRYHSGSNAGGLSTKMLKCVRHQFDWHSTQGKMHEVCGVTPPTVVARPLHQAAVAIRQQLMSSPSWKKRASAMQNTGSRIDTHMALLFDMEHTRYILTDDTNGRHRLSAHYFCTDRFLSCFLEGDDTP